MSATDGGTWPSFAAHVAELASVPAEQITPEARLVQSLGLDSLALTELILALRESYEAPDRQVDLEGRNWQTMTVGQLFETFTGSRAPAGTSSRSA